MRIAWHRAALLCAAALATGPARAAAPPFCSVSTSALNFGSYLPSEAPVQFTATIEVHCTGGPATFTIALTGGQSGNVRVRQMSTAGKPSLRYQIYLDPARTRLWGDGAIGNLAGPYTGNSAQLTVYGLLYSGQHVPAGASFDTLTAILNY